MSSLCRARQSSRASASSRDFRSSPARLGSASGDGRLHSTIAAAGGIRTGLGVAADGSVEQPEAERIDAAVRVAVDHFRADALLDLDCALARNSPGRLAPALGSEGTGKIRSSDLVAFFDRRHHGGTLPSGSGLTLMPAASEIATAKARDDEQDANEPWPRVQPAAFSRS